MSEKIEGGNAGGRGKYNSCKKLFHYERHQMCEWNISNSSAYLRSIAIRQFNVYPFLSSRPLSTHIHIITAFWSRCDIFVLHSSETNEHWKFASLINAIYLVFVHVCVWIEISLTYVHLFLLFSWRCDLVRINRRTKSYFCFVCVTPQKRRQQLQPFHTDCKIPYDTSAWLLPLLILLSFSTCFLRLSSLNVCVWCLPPKTNCICLLTKNVRSSVPFTIFTIQCRPT